MFLPKEWAKPIKEAELKESLEKQESLNSLRCILFECRRRPKDYSERLLWSWRWKLHPVAWSPQLPHEEWSRASQSWMHTRQPCVSSLWSSLWDALLLGQQCIHDSDNLNKGKAQKKKNAAKTGNQIFWSHLLLHHEDIFTSRPPSLILQRSVSFSRRFVIFAHNCTGSFILKSHPHDSFLESHSTNWFWRLKCVQDILFEKSLYRDLLMKWPMVLFLFVFAYVLAMCSRSCTDTWLECLQDVVQESRFKIYTCL